MIDTGPKRAPVAPAPEREIDVLRRTVALIQDRLPPAWSAEFRQEARIGDHRIDGSLRLTAPGATATTLIFEAKRSVVTAHLPAIFDQLRHYADRADEADGPVVPVLVARYLNSGAKSWLERHGLSYADATGNILISVDQPALFLRDRGADKDPWRGPGRPRGGLVGPAAARVVRALVDFFPPMSVPALVARSGASVGATYRVVEFLEQEALIDREPRGPIRTIEWRRIVERWGQDYGFQKSNTVGSYLEPRGIAALKDRLSRSADLHYAVSGSLAAQRIAPYAPARVAMIHVDNPTAAADLWGLRPVDTGANVLLASGEFDVVFDRNIAYDGITYVAPSQVAADLLGGPGRSPAEGQAVLDWMETHESEWRR